MVNVDKLNKDIDGFGKVVERINQLPNQFEKLDETSNVAQKLLEQSKGLQEEQKEIPNLLKKQLESTDGEIKKIKELVEEENFESMLKYYKIEKIEDMKYDDAVALIERKTNAN